MISRRNGWGIAGGTVKTRESGGDVPGLAFGESLGSEWSGAAGGVVGRAEPFWEVDTSGCEVIFAEEGVDLG